MGHVERGVLLFAADQFDGIHQLLGIRIIEQEWKALNGFVRQAAAAGFFHARCSSKRLTFMARARELFTTHRAGRSAADDRYLSHVASR